VHPNTAFGLAFALDYARAVGNQKLEALIVERSRFYYGHDVNYPAAWEPGGEDFFSPALIEADLMRRVMRQSEFAVWFHRFLPARRRRTKGIAATRCCDRPHRSEVGSSRRPESESRLVHAQHRRRLAAKRSAREVLTLSALAHAKVTLPHVASGNYEGEHWLASFAVYLLTTPAP